MPVALPDSAAEDVVHDGEARTKDERPSLPRPLPSIIGLTVVMKGELIVGEDLVIEGKFEGTIVGRGQDTITIRRTARLRGEISASKVRVDDGIDLKNAVLSGRIGRADR